MSGSYDDLSVSVTQTSINAIYGVNKHFGFVMGLSYFDADIVNDDDSKKQDISYGYDGAYIGMHFFL